MIAGDAHMILYKYLHPDRVDVLTNKMIRFTQPTIFNDPFETELNIKRFASEEYTRKVYDELLEKKLSSVPKEFRQYVRKIMEKDESRECLNKKMGDLLPQSKEVIKDTIAKNVGILSLTEEKNNLLMWSHYAFSHTGFVIGFDSQNEFLNFRRSEQDEFGYLKKVQYKQNRPSLNFAEMNSEDVFFTKSIHWAYEKEWRILQILDNADYKDDPIYLFKFQTAAVKEIILGDKIADSEKNNILKIINANYDYVTIYQSKIDESEYKLNFEKIFVKGQ